MIGTLLDVCWWFTKHTCSSLWCLVLPQLPSLEEQLRQQIKTLETKVQQLEEKLETTGIEDFDVLPVTLAATQ